MSFRPRPAGTHRATRTTFEVRVKLPGRTWTVVHPTRATETSWDAALRRAWGVAVEHGLPPDRVRVIATKVDTWSLDRLGLPREKPKTAGD